jgi:hypothetical protein
MEAILAPFINDMTSFKIQKLQWGLLSHKYMTQMLYPCGHPKPKLGLSDARSIGGRVDFIYSFLKIMKQNFNSS